VMKGLRQDFEFCNLADWRLRHVLLKLGMEADFVGCWGCAAA